MHKTILITGSTDGIGLATAKQLASQGHHLLLHGRNLNKLEDTKNTLSAFASSGTIECYQADLSNLDEVMGLAKTISDQHSHLDILINNAGVFRVPQARTADDMDVRFVVNTLAPYLLTQRLLPLMDTDSRVVNLSSAAQAPVDLEAMAGKIPLQDDFTAYAQSKLALTAWSRTLALSLPDGHPMICSVNPGSLLASKMVKDGFGVAGNDLSIGADILVRAALSDEFACANGLYFDNDAKQFAPPHADATNPETAHAIFHCLNSLLESRLKDK